MEEVIAEGEGADLWVNLGLHIVLYVGFCDAAYPKLLRARLVVICNCSVCVYQ